MVGHRSKSNCIILKNPAQCTNPDKCHPRRKLSRHNKCPVYQCSDHIDQTSTTTLAPPEPTEPHTPSSLPEWIDSAIQGPIRQVSGASDFSSTTVTLPTATSETILTSSAFTTTVPPSPTSLIPAMSTSDSQTLPNTTSMASPILTSTLLAESSTVSPTKTPFATLLQQPAVSESTPGKTSISPKNTALSEAFNLENVI